MSDSPSRGPLADIRVVEMGLIAGPFCGQLLGYFGAGRIYRAPEMLADPHFAAREAIVETEHSVLGMLKMQGAFPKLSETPGEIRWPGPAPGAHNQEIWGGLMGCSAERLAELKGRGVI